MEELLQELQDILTEAFNQCIAHGMKLPFIVSAISINGSVLVLRVNDGRGPDMLAEHFEDDVFTSPVNLMVVDRHGEAARVLIAASGKISLQ
jgi:hypothetical protein